MNQKWLLICALQEATVPQMSVFGDSEKVCVSNVILVVLLDTLELLQ